MLQRRSRNEHRAANDNFVGRGRAPFRTVRALATVGAAPSSGIGLRPLVIIAVSGLVLVALCGAFLIGLAAVGVLATAVCGLEMLRQYATRPAKPTRLITG
jgi:hypothetical protein